jgi:hypothetical protein
MHSDGDGDGGGVVVVAVDNGGRRWGSKSCGVVRGVRVKEGKSTALNI